MNFSNRVVLITGASAGIGEAFAREFARRGSRLILVARSKDRLERVAADLRSAGSPAVQVLPADLSQPGAAASIAAQIEGPVDVLINNAGFGTYGKFETIAPAKESEEIQVNIMALVELTHALAPGMLERQFGAIVNIASTAAFQPLAHMAVYAASKAFVLSFSEALWAEFRHRGVRVLAVCPGPVETSFFNNAGIGEANFNRGHDTPENVVNASLRALAAGKCYVVPRFHEWLLANAVRLAPRSVVAAASAKATDSPALHAAPVSP